MVDRYEDAQLPACSGNLTKNLKSFTFLVIWPISLADQK
jgi:hypothetical protein